MSHGYGNSLRLGLWILNAGVPGSKPLDGFNDDSAFHPSKINQVGTWELIGKK